MVSCHVKSSASAIQVPLQGEWKVFVLFVPRLTTRNDTLLQASEPVHHIDRKVLASYQPARGNGRAIMQVKRITFENVRSISIGQRRISCVQLHKQFNISNCERHPRLIECRIRVFKLKFQNKSS